MVHAERMANAYKKRIHILGDHIKQLEGKLQMKEEAYQCVCKELAALKASLVPDDKSGAPSTSQEKLLLETHIVMTEANASSVADEPTPKVKSRRRRTTPEPSDEESVPAEPEI